MQSKAASQVGRSRLTITKAELDRACAQSAAPSGQSDKIWGALERLKADKPQFNLATVAWYFGALIVLVAMGWFLGEMATQKGEGATLVTSLVYTGVFVGLGYKLWFRDGLSIPGGLLFTLAVLLTPLTLFTANQLWHFPVGDHLDLFLEGATVLAGLFALRFVKFSFLSSPVFLSLWCMSWTVSELLLKGSADTWNAHLYVSMGFGALMLLASFVIDKASDEDYAFWGYLFGTASFWIPLSMLGKGGEFGHFVYLLINLGLMFLSVLINRRIFVIAGTLGALGYIFHLSFVLFADSLMFPFVLTLIGAGIIYLGITYHRNQATVDSFVLGLVPDAVRRHLPPAR